MRIRLLIPFILVVCSCNLAIGQQDIEETRLAVKLELLGAVVERDENQPNRPVVHVVFDRAKRFNEKYIHLLKGFKHLESIDLGSLQITDQVLDQIEQPQVLANLLMNATIPQYDAIFTRFQQCGEPGIAYLTKQIDNPPASNERTSTSSQRDKHAMRMANAAIALLRLHQPEKVWPLLKHNPDPRVRSYLIDRFQILCIAATDLIEHFHRETDTAIRRALLLSLGEYRPWHMPDSARAEFRIIAKATYKSDPDPGMHAAAEWLLKKWGDSTWIQQTVEEWRDESAWKQSLAKVETALADPVERTKPQWYVNSQGQEVVVIPGPVTFMMGSPESEPDRHIDEKQHLREINRTYALTATAVTVEQFHRFDKNHDSTDAVARRELPAVEIDWQMGGRYCNWLSDLEGLQPCYIINEKTVSLRDNYLSLSGYRFPTEAELEYATRAGTSTSRYYGETEELLSRYAWYRSNSEKRLQYVGLLKPNDFGLFDLLGNVFVWCQDPYEAYRSGEPTVVDKETIFLLPALKGRVLRGGSFNDQASYVRSAYRYSLAPSLGARYIGIRLARTILSEVQNPEKRASEAGRD